MARIYKKINSYVTVYVVHINSVDTLIFVKKKKKIV
jgi:hypothetical protein